MSVTETLEVTGSPDEGQLTVSGDHWALKAVYDALVAAMNPRDPLLPSNQGQTIPLPLVVVKNGQGKVYTITFTET